jgi:hypothetical protein
MEERLLIVFVTGISVDMFESEKLAEVKEKIIQAVSMTGISDWGLGKSNVRCCFIATLVADSKKEIFFKYGGRGIDGLLDPALIEGVHENIKKIGEEIFPGVDLIRID